MTNTVNNSIPFVPENTTDPAAGLNLSLLTVDMLLHLAVESIGTNAPPTTPTDGARYIVGTAPTDAWAGQANKLAMWVATPGYWTFRSAYFAYNKTDNTIYVFNTNWSAYATTPGSAGETNTASNLGTGAGLYKQKVGVDLQFKTLSAGTNISLDTTTDTDLIIINGPTVPDATIISINSQTGTAYTLALTDKGLCVEMNNAAANTLTIPPNSSVAFPVGTTILIRQMGTGNTTIAAGSGVTIRNPHGTLKIAKQYATVSIHQRATDEWCIDGNMAES